VLWSFTSGITTIVFVFIGPGDVWLLVLLAMANGLPLGAKFLADAVGTTPPRQRQLSWRAASSALRSSSPAYPLIIILCVVCSMFCWLLAPCPPFCALPAAGAGGRHRLRR
jgi:hypothetical protein